MKMLTEIWVNWCYDEEHGYNVHEFHEWRNPTDPVKLINRIPLLKINPDLFTHIENSLDPLAEKLLNLIKDKSYYIYKYDPIVIKYCCILTDGNRYLVIDTDETQIPRKKSRLMPKQEKKLYEVVDELDTYEFSFKPKIKKQNQFISIADEYMLGLTRRERVLKELLFYIFEHLQYEKDLPRLRYYYLEFNPISLDEVNKLNYDELFVSLFGEVKKGWSDNHHNLLKSLLGLSNAYKVIYEDEMSYEVKRNWVG